MNLITRFIKSWLILFQKKKIESGEDLNIFLRQKISKISGKLVIGYSQLRLGKRHYEFCKDKGYAQDLIKAQIKVHKIVTLDVFQIVRDLLEMNIEETENFKALLLDIHKNFVETAPDNFEKSIELTLEDFKVGDEELRDLALISGKAIYNVLPLTENMHKSNFEVFQGQIRLHYINLITDLEKMIVKERVREILRFSV